MNLKGLNRIVGKYADSVLGVRGVGYSRQGDYRGHVIERKPCYFIHDAHYYGGNSGYVEYSMSRRAKEAREEGRYPKGDFRREYGVTDKALVMLTDMGYIDDGEWHHTSKYGNKTVFYGWSSEDYPDLYMAHKGEIDRLARQWVMPEGAVNPNDVDYKTDVYIMEAINSDSALKGEASLSQEEEEERSRRHNEISASGKERIERRYAHEDVDYEYAQLYHGRHEKVVSKIKETAGYKDFARKLEEGVRIYNTWQEQRGRVEEEVNRLMSGE